MTRYAVAAVAGAVAGWLLFAVVVLAPDALGSPGPADVLLRPDHTVTDTAPPTDVVPVRQQPRSVGKWAAAAADVRSRLPNGSHGVRPDPQTDTRTDAGVSASVSGLYIRSLDSGQKAPAPQVFRGLCGVG